jgi:RNA polymerase sigma-70 factor (ECF subfamily)
MAPNVTPQTAAVAQEQETALHHALQALPEDYRRVIEWRNFEGLSFADIGQRLHRSAEAARMLWARAVEQLGRALRPSDASR